MAAKPVAKRARVLDWDSARYNATWAECGWAQGGRTLTLPELQRAVGVRLNLLLSMRSKKPAPELAAALPDDLSAVAFHVIVQALVRGQRHAPTHVRAVASDMVAAETALVRARIRKKELRAEDVAGLTRGDVVKLSGCAKEVRDALTAMMPPGTLAVVRVPFEHALAAVASRRAFLLAGDAYVDEDTMIDDAIVKFSAVVNACVVRVAHWPPGARLEPRIAEMQARVREGYARALRIERQVAAAEEGTLSLDDALRLAPTCVQSAWAILQNTGALPNEYRPLLVIFCRETGVSQSELWLRFEDALRRHRREAAKVKSYAVDVRMLYRQRHLRVPGCANVLANRHKGLQCASEVTDIEEIGAYQGRCAIQCGVVGALPRTWGPMVAFWQRQKREAPTVSTPEPSPATPL
jgi:hypothetical protein